ncbi:SDR family NAD(P)-dependent oxidoreductase [Nocardia sp. NPDC050710]|uniref:SDR family NAD(P)-dependent oxidoreductase n=1 Tax=Nocardia sp. NPDC050710 TaxID=3157220 RepID=UPI0033E1101A
MTAADPAPPPSHPPVSIVGMGCRVPGADTVPEFWSLLLAGRDATGDPPVGRAVTRRAGYLPDIDRFDNEWFAISGREAALMDPQQRLALEVAVEAIDDAGIGYRVRGSGGAVVFGACGYDHGITVLGAGGMDAPYAVTGSALSIIANRLSYVLDLHGPSLVVDSACSSSLAAVDVALRLLADETVPFAIVGGVNLTLLPHTSDYLAESGFLAEDGRCKPFDAAADGYTRSDGCGVIVLRRTADAVRAGERVYAEIAGAAVGSDGRSNGLYAPNGRAQRETLRTAWSRAGLDPQTSGYIECHGTGTALGDAVEVGALAAVLAGSDAADAPTWIGSVKSNLGHLEAAAGVTGLIKTALSIHHGVIAPTINFRSENPLLKLEEHGLRVPTEPVDWSATPIAQRHAGVSSFGFGGTNAHVVLRGPAAPANVRGAEPPALFPLTGRDLTELRARAAELAEGFESADADPAVHYSAVVTRENADLSPGESALHRVAAATARLIPETARATVLAYDRDEARDRLRALARGDSDAGITGPSSTRRRGGVLFLFSGQGGQYPKMGRALAARYPVFAHAVTVAADAIVAAGGPRIWTPRTGFAVSGNGRAATELVQPAIFAYQIALTELLASWGVRPDAVVGHSLGEIAGAVASGGLTLPDAARIVVQRSRLLATLDGQGAMALLEAAPEAAAQLVEPMRTQVSIAAVNGPRSVVVSGTPRYIDTVVRRAKRRNIFAQRIAVDFAAHSPQVAAVLPEFVAALGELAPRPPHTPLYSTTRRGAVIDAAVLHADYWAENASGTVELAAALDRAAADGLATVVEIAPHPVLIPAVREYADFRESAHPATTRADEAAGLLTCLARLYTEGRTLDWSALGPYTGSVSQRHWRRQRFALLAPADPDSGAPGFVPDALDDHVVRGVATVPAVYWLRRLLHLARTESATVIRDFVVHELTEVSALPRIGYRRYDSGSTLRVQADDAGVLASAQPAGDPVPADIVSWMRTADANRAVRHRMHSLEAGYFYAQLRSRELEYGPRFRPLRRIAAGPGRALGIFEDAELHNTATLDGCLHLLAAACYDDLPDNVVPLPIGIESAWLSTEPGRVVLEGHALIRERSAHGLIGDIVGTDQHGAPVLALTGVRIRFTDRGSRGDAAKSIGDTPLLGAPTIFRRETWQPLHPDSIGHPGTEARPGIAQRALVIGESPAAVRLARALEDRVPTERVAREPDEAAAVLASVLFRRAAAHTAVVVVWPSDAAVGGDPAGSLGRMLGLLQLVQSSDVTASLTMVLPAVSPRGAVVPHAIAGLIRSLQLESGRPIRLVWADDDADSTALLAGVITAGPDEELPDEVRLTAGDIATRRFTTTAARGTPPSIDSHGTYVVTGGLGALGAVAVRWLLDAGAHDVVVLTRSPRPVPPLLDGLEDRIVVVRCDAADRSDLANALSDIRECGSIIRGVVHAAGTLEDAAFDTVDAALLTRMLAPKVTAAADLIALTADDPTDFLLLFSSATGALGAPGQSAYAAANAAMDALADSEPGRRILSIGWGVWESGLAEAAGGAIHLRRAGIAAFDSLRGAELLAQALRHPDSYLLAVDYTPTADMSPVAARLRNLLAPQPDSTRPDTPEAASAATVAAPAPIAHHTAEPLTATIRRVLAATVDLPAESIEPTADFNELGLSSLLAIELRRNLESRLKIAISTAELFQHPTVAALGAVLAERVAAANSGAAS